LHYSNKKFNLAQVTKFIYRSNYVKPQKLKFLERGLGENLFFRKGSPPKVLLFKLLRHIHTFLAFDILADSSGKFFALWWCEYIHWEI